MKGEGPYLFWKSVIRVNHIPIYRGSQKGLFWLPRDSYTYLDGNQTPRDPICCVGSSQIRYTFVKTG